MSKNTLIVATRASALARAQADMTLAHYAAALPGTACEIFAMTTTGDQKLHWSLEQQGGKGLFTKELEDALLDGRADIAVHSAKDLPTELPAGLCIAGFLPRADPRDVLVKRAGVTTPRTIASGSPRRREQGRKLWPGAEWSELRGNVGTRLRKIAEEGAADATLLAAAGLARLGIHAHAGLVFEPLSLDQMIPAAGQAAIAIECRTADLARFAESLDARTALSVGIERMALSAFGGGCHSASAAHHDGATLHLLLPGGQIARIPFAPASAEEAAATLPGLLEKLK
jgi:hydroxymethylbilane synthase